MGDRVGRRARAVVRISGGSHAARALSGDHAARLHHRRDDRFPDAKDGIARARQSPRLNAAGILAGASGAGPRPIGVKTRELYADVVAGPCWPVQRLLPRTGLRGIMSTRYRSEEHTSELQSLRHL